MSRELFLSNQWAGYRPVRDQDQGYFFGRVLRCDASEVVILRDQVETLISNKEYRSFQDAYWGPAIPWNFIRVGDCLMKKDGALFMLAPNRQESWQMDTHARDWSNFMDYIQSFFQGRGFLHFHTPYLVTSPGVDHHIDFMGVKAVQTKRQWCLPTSPEIHLKKALCRGYENIFEIKKCFRDDLPGPLHSAEFTMLEWYRAYAPLNEIKKDIQDLIESLVSSKVNMMELSVAEAFSKYLNFHLKPETSREELLELIEAQQLDWAPDDDWNTLFFRLFMEKVEPYLGVQEPLFLHSFPPQQASLSQLNPQGWSARFELYWQGVELANAYLEVNDPKENRERFEEQSQLRRDRKARVSPMDEEFFRELEKGMPPASGVALGLDRLFVLIQKKNESLEAAQHSS